MFSIGRMMREWTMRLKMEIIPSVKFYHTSDGSSFTLVSTYLQNTSSGCTSLNPRWISVRASQQVSNTPLCSHSDAILSLGSICIMPLPWKPVGLEFSDGRHTTHSGPTCSVQNDGFFPWTYVAFGGQYCCSNIASHQYTVSNLIWNENMWLTKTHSPRTLDN